MQVAVQLLLGRLAWLQLRKNFRYILSSIRFPYRPLLVNSSPYHTYMYVDIVSVDEILLPSYMNRTTDLKILSV